MTQARWAPLALRTLWLLYFTALFLATHMPVPAGLPPTVSDKALHVMAFMPLAWLSCAAWETTARRVDWRVVLALVLYGAVDELLQWPVGRNADVWDWVADTVGVAIGVGLYLLTRGALQRWTGHRGESNTSERS